MTLAEALHVLVPGYSCTGNIDDSTEEQYNALVWEDLRAKPTWSEISAVMAEEIPIVPTLEDRVEALEEEVFPGS